MRFSRFPRHEGEREVTARHLAHARRAIQKSQDDSPLFPEFSDQRTPEQRVADNNRHRELHWQETRDETAKSWRRARRLLRIEPGLRPLQRLAISRWWQKGVYPGSPVYLLGCIHDAKAKRTCFWHKLATSRRFELIHLKRLNLSWKQAAPPQP